MLILEAYTILFAYICARLNKTTCQKMIDFGASIKEEKEWHLVNWLLKLMWAFSWASISLFAGEPLMYSLSVFIVLALLQWAVFDPVLGKLLHDDWFFIGTTAKTDKIISKLFGDDAGLWKFLICCILILMLNFYVC